MKKTFIIGISIASIFILCSLTYQPIIANENTESTIVNEAVISTEKINMQTVINLLKRTAEDDDCGCEDENKKSSFRDFPIICEILWPIALFGIFLVLTFNIEIVGLIAFTLGRIFNCSWA